VLTNGAISEANILTEAEAALTYQPLDADLTELAALTSTNVAVRTASGWISTNHLWLSDITANNGIVFEVNAGSTTYQLGDGDFITLNANATLGTQNDPWDEMWGNQLWVTSDDELQTFFIGHASGPAIFQITASQPVLMEASTITLDGASSVILQGNNVNAGQFDGNNTAGNTRFLLYDVDNGTLERVSVGIADSGGVGYKVLRIPN
jgi:hypothetical protein